jgi:hypothetical protein
VQEKEISVLCPQTISMTPAEQLFMNIMVTPRSTQDSNQQPLADQFFD